MLIVSGEGDGRIEHKPLVRVGFAFLPHVIGCGLAEVKSAQRYLGDFISGQLDSETNNILLSDHTMIPHQASALLTSRKC